MSVMGDWFGGKVKFVLLLVLLFAVSVCGVSIGMDLWREWSTPPEQRVSEALRYATEAPMYRYTSEAVRIHNGQEQLVTTLNGEKCGENVHLYGTANAIESSINVYQIGDTFYRQDIVSGQWMQMTGQNLEATEYLMQEINPFGCLMFGDNAQVIEQEEEKVNDVNCKKYQVKSSGEATFLTSVWNEFYYTVWIDKKHRLQQAEIIADDHENEAEQLRLTIQFDWSTEVPEITAPV